MEAFTGDGIEKELNATETTAVDPPFSKVIDAVPAPGFALGSQPVKVTHSARGGEPPLGTVS
jgi:hypothetical protein